MVPERKPPSTENTERNVIRSVRCQKYLHTLLRSAQETSSLLTTGRCQLHSPTPRRLLPYSSTGNAVLPHLIPYGGDVTKGIRWAWRKQVLSTALSARLKTYEQQQDCDKSSRMIRACCLLNHKLHPTALTFHSRSHRETRSFAKVTVSVPFRSPPCPGWSRAQSCCSCKLPDDQVR